LIFLTKLHKGLEETQCIQSCMRHFECKIKLAEPKNGTTCPSYKLCAKVRGFKLALGKEKKMLLSHFETVCLRANIFVFWIDNSSRSLTKTLFYCEKFVARKEVTLQDSAMEMSNFFFHCFCILPQIISYINALLIKKLSLSLQTL
jgi:hypothetical protein